MPEKTLREFVDLLGFKLAPWQEQIIEKIESNPDMHIVMQRGRNFGRMRDSLANELHCLMVDGLMTPNGARTLLSTGEAEIIIDAGAAMRLKSRPKTFIECTSFTFDEANGCRVKLKRYDPAKYALKVDPRGAAPTPLPLVVVDEADVANCVAEEFVKLQNLVTPKELDTARDLSHALRLFDDEIEKAIKRRDGTVKAARKAKQNFIQKNLSR